MKKFPAEYKEIVHDIARRLIEAACEADEKLFEKFVGGEAISNEELKAAIRKATIAIKMTPVLCGSAFKNKGVQQLLDAVVIIFRLAGRYSAGSRVDDGSIGF